MSNYGNDLRSWASTGQRLGNVQKLGKTPVDRQSRDDLQLIGAQIFFRHGARTPLRLLPGLEEVAYKDEHVKTFPPSQWDVKLITKLGNDVVEKDQILSANDIFKDRMRALKTVSGESILTGQLTAVGEKQLYQLGQAIRPELIGDNDHDGILPSTYDPQLVYCRSTYMDRTIASARSFLAGLFSSATTEKQVQSKGPFEIEVHHFPDEHMFPNPKVAPSLQQCDNASSLYSSLNEDHDLRSARQAFINRLGLEDSRHGIVELHDDIVSRQAHDFSVPTEVLELTKGFDEMSAREFVAMATSIDFNLFIRSTCGPLLYLMNENLKSIRDHYIEGKENPYQKLFIYSGHDTTLIPLAMAFEIFDMHWPKYAAFIFLQYFISKSNPEETFVTINYAGQPQILPNCDSFYCPYSTFLSNLQDRLEQPKRVTKE